MVLLAQGRCDGGGDQDVRNRRTNRRGRHDGHGGPDERRVVFWHYEGDGNARAAFGILTLRLLYGEEHAHHRHIDHRHRRRYDGHKSELHQSELLHRGVRRRPDCHVIPWAAFYSIIYRVTVHSHPNPTSTLRLSPPG